MVTEHPPQGRTVLAAALLIALVVLVYLPGLHGGFAFDDYHSIVQNPTLELHNFDLDSLLDAAMSGVGTGPLGRPLAMLSFAANRTLGGLDPWSYKLTNIVIHALNALMVWALLWRLLPALSPRTPRGAAWLIAGLWALHPINLTSVLYVVQRMTSLASSFMLLSLLVYVGCRQRQMAGRAVPLAGIFGCATLALHALLCKEAALSLTLYVLLIEGCALRRPPLAPATRGVLGMAAVAIVLAGLWYFWRVLLPGYAYREFTLPERLWSEARVLWTYLRLLLVPTPGAFTLFHDDLTLSRGWLSPPTTLLAVLGLATVSVLAFAGRAARPFLAFGWGWFMLGHALESSFLPLELMHEHRNYLPGLGIVTAVTLALTQALARTPRPAAGPLCAVLALAVLGTMTASRAALWATPQLQIETELRHHPASPRLWYEAGRLRLETANGDATRTAAGIAALEQAAALAPIKTLPWSALLKTAIEGRDEATIARLVPLIVAEPREVVGEDVFRELVICQGYGRCRRDGEPVQRLANALLAREGLSTLSRQRLLELLAVFYARTLGDSAAAITILKDLVAARPQELALKTRLAEAYAGAGQQAEAVALARQVRASLPPGSVLMQRTLRARLARLLDDEHAP